MVPQLITGNLKCQAGYVRPVAQTEVRGCFPWHNTEIPETSTKFNNTKAELIEVPASKPKHNIVVMRLLGDVV